MFRRIVVPREKPFVDYAELSRQLKRLPRGKALVVETKSRTNIYSKLKGYGCKNVRVSKIEDGMFAVWLG